MSDTSTNSTPAAAPQGNPTAPTGQPPAAPATEPPASTPAQEPAPSAQAAQSTSAPAEQPQPQQPAPIAPPVEGDISRLPQWAQRAITDSQAAARTAAVQTAVYQAAPGAGADPLVLLDSVSFRAAVEAIDPADTTALPAAITAAVTANPRLGAAPAAPARGGAEFNGPPAGDRKPATLADAIAAKFGG